MWLSLNIFLLSTIFVSAYPQGHLIDDKSFLKVHEHYANPNGPTCYKPMMTALKKSCKRLSHQKSVFLAIKLRNCDMSELHLKQLTACADTRNATKCLNKLTTDELSDLTSYVIDIFHICNHFQFRLLVDTAHTTLSTIRHIILQSIRLTKGTGYLRTKVYFETDQLFKDILDLRASGQSLDDVTIAARLFNSTEINDELSGELLVILHQTVTFDRESAMAGQRLTNVISYGVCMLATYWFVMDVVSISRSVLLFVWTVEFGVCLAFDALGKFGVSLSQVYLSWRTKLCLVCLALLLELCAKGVAMVRRGSAFTWSELSLKFLKTRFVRPDRQSLGKPFSQHCPFTLVV